MLYTDSTRVVLQHRNGLLRDGLALLLDARPKVTVVGAVPGVPALVALCDTERPDAIVLEVGPTGCDPCVVAARLRRRNRSVRVIGLHRGLRAAECRRLLTGGLQQLVHSGTGAGALLAAVDASAPSHAVIDLRAGGALVEGAGPYAGVPRHATAGVTDREREVLYRVSQGETTAEIARQLGISPKTVENHKQRLFIKLGVQNQAHAVSVALRSGLLSSGDPERAANGV